MITVVNWIKLFSNLYNICSKNLIQLYIFRLMGVLRFDLCKQNVRSGNFFKVNISHSCYCSFYLSWNFQCFPTKDYMDTYFLMILIDSILMSCKISNCCSMDHFDNCNCRLLGSWNFHHCGFTILRWELIKWGILIALLLRWAYRCNCHKKHIPSCEGYIGGMFMVQLLL